MKRQDGYIIVVLAASLVVLLGFAAMAVDSGVLFSAQTAAQRAADGAALAGAFTFVTSPTATQPATAQNHALQTAMQNKVLRSFVQNGEVTVNVDVGNRRVTVDISHGEGTYFAKALGFRNTTINVEAVAEAAPTACGGPCIKPWFIPNTIHSTQSSSAQACTAAEYLIDPVTLAVNTAYVNPLLGQLFVIKPGHPSGAWAPGQFYTIRMSNDNNSGQQYRTNISTCSSASTLFCGGTFSLLQGNKVGPTGQGVDDLVTIFGTTTADTWAGFTGPNGEAMYDHPNGTTTDTSHQVVVTPILNDCDPAVINGLNNGDPIPIAGFALVFIEGNQGHDVLARLINVSACTMTPQSGCGSPAFTFPLRLVRTS